MARKVAVLSRTLLAEQVSRVDRAVAKAIRGHAPSTVLEIARAKVIEADPETHRAERESSRHERYVRLSRTNEFGYRHIIARVTAGDATWTDAMLDRVADILDVGVAEDLCELGDVDGPDAFDASYSDAGAQCVVGDVDEESASVAELGQS